MKPSRMPARRPITGKLLKLLRHPMLTLSWGDPQHITLMVPGQELTLPATPTLRHLIRTDMTTPHATVYTSPGCSKCRATSMMLRKMGVEVTDALIEGYPDKYAYMRDNSLSLPLVEVIMPDRSMVTWNDMSMDDIDALRYLMKDEDAA